MTSVQPMPVRTFDISDYDYGSPIFERQLAGYNALRESFLQRQLVQTGMLSQELPTPAMMQQNFETPETDWTDDDLLGAAQFWGIAPDIAKQLPREQLLQYVTQQRTMARPSDEESSSWINGGAALGAFGLSVPQTIVRGLRNLPLIGEGIGRIELVHKANIYMKSLEEGLRASTPESIQMVLTGEQVVGNIATLVVPATMAWKGAGAAGALVPFAGRVSPIVRGAVQGIASTWLLEGGNPDIQQNRDIALGLGARDIAYGAAGLFGAAGPLAVSAWRRFRPLTDAAANKVVGAYVPNETVLGPTPPVSVGFEPTALDIPPSLPSPLSKLDDLEASFPAPSRPLSPLVEGFESIPEPIRSQIGGPFPEGFSTTSQTTTRRPAPPIEAFHGSSAGQHGFTENRPSWFTSSPDDIFLKSGREIARADLAMGKPLTLSAARNRIGEIQGALATQGVPKDQADEILGFIANGDPSAFFNVDTKIAAAYRSLGFDGIIVDQGLKNNATWYVSLGNESISNVRWQNGFTTDRAEANAIGLTKASTVLNSPDAPFLVAQPVLDDVTVGRAAVSANPGGSNVVQAVSDPATFAQETTKLGAFVRYATPKGTKRLDAIVSDAPVTNKMVSEYEKLGVYTSQSVTTRNGIVGRIEGINGDVATLKIDNTDATIKLRVKDLAPNVESQGVIEVPQLWDQFVGFTQTKALNAAEQLGGGFPSSQLDALMNENMPLYMDEFIESLGVTKGDAARIGKYFNTRYVETFKQLAPAEVLQAERLTQSAVDDLLWMQSMGFPQDILNGQAALRGLPPTLRSVDELAATKGMVVSPKANGGYELIDMVGRVDDKVTEVSFNDLESAGTWLNSLNRELPDLSPKLGVPGEIAPMHLTEATQLPNLNTRIEDDIAREILDLDPADNLIGMLGAQAATLRESGRLGKLQNLYINGFTNLSSMRRLFSTMDEFAAQGGLEGLTPFQDYQKISVAATARHNFEEPLQEAAAMIMQDIRVANRRSGLWSQMYLIEDPVERIRISRERGLNDAEIAAFDKLSEYWHGLFQETGLSPERELRNYLPMLQKMQSTGDFAGSELWTVTPGSDAFFKHVRSGAINVRELDPEALLNVYIKELSWDKHMASQFEEVASKWNAIRREVPELEPAAQIVQNYLHTVRYGYQPGPDALLDWTHGVARTLLGEGITRHQARQLVNYGLNASYSSLMGYRLDIIARDMQQIWLAAPRVGPKLLSTIKTYITSPTAVKQAMWERAVEDNMVSLVHPRSMSPGATQGFEVAAYDPAEIAAGNVSRRQQLIGKVMGSIEDMVPNWMKSEKLRPGYLYGRQGEITRMLVGTAQRDLAEEALGAFRAAGANGDMKMLLSASKADTFHPAVRREFQRLVGLGDDAEAARFLGRQQADASQFKYGAGEGPIANRTVSGRMFAQLGSYPLYYAQYIEEIARHGTAASQVAAVATAGGISAAFYGASQATGWNFNRLNPFTGLGFTGGPVLQEAIGAAQTASAYVREFTGQNTDGQSPPSLGGAALGAAQLFNPMRGLGRTVQGIGMAMDSPTPGAAMLRLGITGERGIGPDLENEFYAVPDMTQMVQPMQSPARIQSFGLPQIPQQQVTPLFLNDSSESEFMKQFDGLPEELRAAALEQYRREQFARQPQGGAGGQF